MFWAEQAREETVEIVCRLAVFFNIAYVQLSHSMHAGLL